MRHHIGGAAARSAEGDARNAGEVLLAQTMEFGCKLGCSFRCRTQWVERDGEVSIAANCVHELSRSGYIAKKSGLNLSRCRRLTNDGSWRCGASYTLSESEELAPRLINRRRIAAVSFVGFGYVSVVKDARNGVGTHTSKFNCALPPSARRYRSQACTSDAMRQPSKSASQAPAPGSAGRGNLQSRGCRTGAALRRGA